MYLKLRVLSNSSKEYIEKISEDTWRVWVKQPPINNAANTRILEIIREAFPGHSVRIISGHHSPSKIVSIG